MRLNSKSDKIKEIKITQITLCNFQIVRRYRHDVNLPPWNSFIVNCDVLFVRFLIDTSNIVQDELIVSLFSI